VERFRHPELGSDGVVSGSDQVSTDGAQVGDRLNEAVRLVLHSSKRPKAIFSLVYLGCALVFRKRQHFVH